MNHPGPLEPERSAFVVPRGMRWRFEALVAVFAVLAWFILYLLAEYRDVDEGILLIATILVATAMTLIPLNLNWSCSLAAYVIPKLQPPPSFNIECPWPVDPTLQHGRVEEPRRRQMRQSHGGRQPGHKTRRHKDRPITGMANAVPNRNAIAAGMATWLYPFVIGCCGGRCR